MNMADVRAAEEDLVCARTEVSDLRAQLEVSLGERDWLAAREAAHRVEAVTLGLSCITPTYLQFASQRCQVLVRVYETRGGDLADRMREAEQRRERALWSIRLLRIVESDEALGCWAPERWHKEEAGKGKPGKRT